VSDPPVLDRGAKLWCWKAIAGKLGVDEDTARTWSQLHEDPLPARRFRDTHWIWERYLVEWFERRQGRGEKLFGWEAICAHLDGCDPKTARRWARPVFDRLPVHGKGRPWIFLTALRDWKHRQDAPALAPPGSPSVEFPSVLRKS
jgi:hypothetical protein